MSNFTPPLQNTTTSVIFISLIALLFLSAVLSSAPIWHKCVALRSSRNNFNSSDIGLQRVLQRVIVSPSDRCQQVFAEFHRINNVNLRNQFYKELDRHTPKLITLFRDKAIKTGKIAEELAKLMRIYDLQEQRDVNMRRALVLRALPVYLREDSFKFFRICNSADGPDLTDTPVALLTVVTDEPTDAALFSPESISIVVEDEILVQEVLKPFKVATEALSTDKYPTASAVLPLIHVLLAQLKRTPDEPEPPALSEMKIKIVTDLEKRYSVEKGAFMLLKKASYLDPRFHRLVHLKEEQRRQVQAAILE
nr:uncharacterized protein LOC129423854 isoform X1 [Misgurnus anguillicaudatus]